MVPRGKLAAVGRRQGGGRGQADGNVDFERALSQAAEAREAAEAHGGNKELDVDRMTEIIHQAIDQYDRTHYLQTDVFGTAR